ncbi:MAG: VOC family protein [Candidatus Adlerbacteria bacterium]
MKSIEDFYTGAVPYIGLFNAFAQKHELVGATGADHLCYKCGSMEGFEDVRAVLEEGSTYLYQTIISGRRIAYIKLKKPIETVLGPIWFIELSDQKPDGSQTDSYDHIEVFPTALTYHEMVERLEKTEKVIHVARPHHTTDDIDIGGFLFRCTQGALIEKIKLEM